MCPDHSDMRMYADLADLNRGFSGLVDRTGRARRAAPRLGLDAAIIDQLRRLSPVRTRVHRRNPGLLACFARLPPASLDCQVAEQPVTHPPYNPAGDDSARLYVTGLLTWFCGRWNSKTGHVVRSVRDSHAQEGGVAGRVGFHPDSRVG